MSYQSTYLGFPQSASFRSPSPWGSSAPLGYFIPSVNQPESFATYRNHAPSQMSKTFADPPQDLPPPSLPQLPQQLLRNGGVRKSTEVACPRCRDRKVKCSGERTGCSHRRVARVNLIRNCFGETSMEMGSNKDHRFDLRPRSFRDQSSVPYLQCYSYGTDMFPPCGNDPGATVHSSQDKDATSIPRRRVQLVCRRCRKSKVRCSGLEEGQESCERCYALGVSSQCVFLRVGSTPMTLEPSVTHPSSALTIEQPLALCVQSLQEAGATESVFDCVRPTPQFEGTFGAGIHHTLQSSMAALPPHQQDADYSASSYPTVNNWTSSTNDNAACGEVGSEIARGGRQLTDRYLRLPSPPPSQPLATQGSHDSFISRRNIQQTLQALPYSTVGVRNPPGPYTTPSRFGSLGALGHSASSHRRRTENMFDVRTGGVQKTRHAELGPDYLASQLRCEDYPGM